MYTMFIKLLDIINMKKVTIDSFDSGRRMKRAWLKSSPIHWLVFCLLGLNFLQFVIAGVEVYLGEISISEPP